MRARSFFKWAFLGLASTATLLIVLLLTLDLGFLAGPLSTQIGKAIGREVTLGEELTIRVGRNLVLEARGLRIANTDWAGDTDLLRIERLYAEIDTASLWQGTPLIRQLEVDGALVDLVQDADGRSNWLLPGDRAAQNRPATAGLPVLWQHIAISDFNLRLQTPRLDRVLELQVTEFDQNLDDRGRLTGVMAGQIHGQEFEYRGTLEPWDRLLSGSDILIEGGGHFGPAKVNLSGRFDKLWAPRRPELELALEAPSLSQLTDMLGVRGLGDGAVSIHGFSRPGPDHVQVEAKVAVGALKADLNAQLASLREAEEGMLAVQARGPNFGRLARLAGYDGWPEEPFDLDARVARSGSQLKIDRLKMDLASASMDVAGVLPSFPGVAGAELDLLVHGPDWGIFRRVHGLEWLREGPFRLSGDVSRPGGGQTHMALAFTTPLGEGVLDGWFVSNTVFDLALNMNGVDAGQLGPLAEKSGLTGQAWHLGLDASMDDPSVFEIARLDFSTKGLTVALDGSLGAETPRRGTQVQFKVQGDRLADFQRLVPDNVILPQATFDARGGLRTDGTAWRLSDVAVQIGDNQYRVDGTVGMTADLSGTDLTMEASGTDIGRLFDLPGAARLPDGPFRSNGRFTLGVDQLTVPSLRLEAGDFELTLAGELPWPLDPAQGRVRATLSGQDVTRVLPEAAGLQLDASAFSLTADGEWHDSLLRLEEGTLRVGDSELSLSGTLDLPPNVSATDLDIALRSPDLSRLGTFRGRRWKAVPFRLDGAFSGTVHKFQLENLRVVLGEHAIRGFFELDTENEIPEFDLKVSAGVVDLRPFLRVPGPKGGSDPKTERENPEKLIPDLRIPADKLARVNGRFLVGVDQMLFNRTTLINNVLNGEIRDGSVTINELGIDTFGGRLAASMALSSGANRPPRFTLGIHSAGLVLDFIDLSREDAALLPRFDVDIDLEGTGVNVREIASTLGGKIMVYSPGGRVKKFETLTGSGQMLARIITSVSPMAATRAEVGISCFAAVADVVDGRVELDPGMALQSDRLNIFAKGSVDLGTEKLDVHFNSTTRRAFDVSAGELITPYVMLSGTLAQPTLAIDPKGTLLSGGAAFLSGGLSILAKKALEQLGTKRDPCIAFLERGEKAETPP
jgi:hypothetical protein